MQVLSFKNTPLFKRGIWLSAAALTACVAVPFLLDADLRRNPLPNLFGVGVLAVFFSYFLWKARLHRLADEVVDCEDRLKVRRGRKEENVQFSNITVVEVSTGGGIQRFTVHLREPTRLGPQIEFLPQARLWGNPSSLQRVAATLTERANQARAMAGLPVRPRP
ncbi:MAG: hypothetical protein WA803_13760 [Steroidobacteraceae bacterium]